MEEIVDSLGFLQLILHILRLLKKRRYEALKTRAVVHTALRRRQTFGDERRVQKIKIVPSAVDRISKELSLLRREICKRKNDEIFIKRRIDGRRPR